MLQSETVRKYDTYKDSGIEWIGKIPHEWNVLPHKYIMSKVKNICEKYDGEDIISLTMKGVIKRDLDNPMGKMPLTFDGYQRIETGNLLLCLFDIDVTPRCVGLIKDDGLTSPAYSQFKFLGQDCPQYYTYLLTMIDDDKCFLHLAKNLRSSLTEDNFGAILTIQPPLEEQQKIADYLDKKCGEIDKVVETEKSVIEKLKEYKQSIITEAVTKGLDKSVPLKDSGIEWIGQIPQNWKVLKFSNIAKVKSNLVNPNEYLSYYQISPENIEKDTGNLLNNFRTVEESGVISGNHLFFKGQILYSKIRPNLNKVTIAPFDGLCSADMYPIETDVNTNSFLYTMLSDTFVSQVKLYIENRVKMPKINQNELSNIYVAIPNDSKEQELIAEYLDKKCSEIDKAISDKEQVIEKFTEYKKSLIYECVTGKKRVA